MSLKKAVLPLAALAVSAGVLSGCGGGLSAQKKEEFTKPLQLGGTSTLPAPPPPPGGAPITLPSQSR